MDLHSDKCGKEAKQNVFKSSELQVITTDSLIFHSRHSWSQIWHDMIYL